MPEMTDPSAALPSFQAALDNDELNVQRARTDLNLLLVMDQPDGGGVRLTYFRAEKAEAIGICMVVQNGFHNDVPCFDLGYAVVDKFRSQGRGNELVEAAIKDHIAGMQRNGVNRFYLEAVVGLDNLASQRIAERHIAQQPEEITDSVSGLPAYRYVLGVGIEP